MGLGDTNSKVQLLRTTSQWNDAFDIAEIFDNSSDSSITDDLIIEAYETAIDLGLSVVSDKEKYIEANKILARQYMRYEKYLLAQKHLLMLDTHLQSKPSWFYIYFANTLLKTTLPNLVQDPNPLFEELDGIDAADASAIEQRRVTFFSFLHEISSGVENGMFSQNDISYQKIFEKAAKYSVIQSFEVEAFHKAVCPGFDITAFIPIAKEIPEQQKSQIIISDTTEYRELQRKYDVSQQEGEKLRKQIAILQTDLSSQAEQIERKNKEIRDIQNILLEKNTDSKKTIEYIKKLEHDNSTQGKKLTEAITIAESKAVELQSTITQLSNAHTKIERLTQENAALKVASQKVAEGNKPLEFEILGYIFGALNLVVIPLRKWLTENFKKMSPNGWYKSYVVDPIIINRGDDNWMARKVKESLDLEFLDAYTLLFIAKRNIDNFYKVKTLDLSVKKDYLYKLSDVRNELSHLDGKEFGKQEIIDMIMLIRDFVQEFSAINSTNNVLNNVITKITSLQFATMNFQRLSLM